MKLIVCIVQDQDSHVLIDDLTESNFRVTTLASTGGFLKSGNTTLLIGVEEEDVDRVFEIIEKNCKTREVSTPLIPVNIPGETYIPQPIDVKVGGATIFMLDVEDHIRM